MLLVSLKECTIRDEHVDEASTGSVFCTHMKQTFRSPTRQFESRGDCSYLKLDATFEVLDENYESGRESYLVFSMFTQNGRTGQMIKLGVGTLKMSEFRDKPEKKLSLRVALVAPGSSNIQPSTETSRGEIYLDVCYSFDFEHPSFLHGFACGLFLCPGAPTAPFASSSSSSKPRQKARHLTASSDVSSHHLPQGAKSQHHFVDENDEKDVSEETSTLPRMRLTEALCFAKGREYQDCCNLPLQDWNGHFDEDDEEGIPNGHIFVAGCG